MKRDIKVPHSEVWQKNVPYAMLQYLLKHVKNYNLKHLNKIDVNSESD